MILDIMQKKAVDIAVTVPEILLITGGPGTGKTTTLRSVVQSLYGSYPDILISMAAPTGKAAKRMSSQVHDVFDGECKTIHRMLEFNPGLGGWKYDRKNPLDSDVIIVDESSMITSEIMYHLIVAIREGGCLILVGDVNQLPPVGCGCPYRDMILSGSIKTIRLQTNYRQQNGSLIASNAGLVLKGKAPILSGEPGGRTLGGTIEDDCFFIEREDVADVADVAIKTAGPIIASGEEFVILTPTKKGGAGTVYLNEMMQAKYNSNDEFLKTASTMLKEGDPVIHLKNNYDLGVFNGETGTIIYLSKKDRELVIDFGDKKIEYSGEALNQLGLAYALTVHKSQGSEYPHVIFICHSTNTFMLKKTLVYTAITRAKQTLTIIGNKKGVAAARSLRNRNDGKRRTYLGDKLIKMEERASGQDIALSPEAREDKDVGLLW